MNYGEALDVLETAASGNARRVLWRVQRAIKPSRRAAADGRPVLAVGSLLELRGFKAGRMRNGAPAVIWRFAVHSAQGISSGVRLKMLGIVVKYHLKPVEVEG